MGKYDKAQALVDANKERKGRAHKAKKKATPMIIGKDRGIRVEPLSARTDPELRAKQIEEKKEEEVRRIKKIEDTKIHRAKVLAKKQKAASDRAKKREIDLLKKIQTELETPVSGVAAGDPPKKATKKPAAKKASKKKS